MKKIVKISGMVALSALFVLALALSMASCSHEHVWGEWQYNETEHWRCCTVKGCGEEQREAHEGYPCETCAAFRAVAFYTSLNDETLANGHYDLAHVSFVNEANEWFAEMGKEYNFFYDSTGDWSNLNEEFLADYDLVLFLDTRPEDAEQRAAFQTYMENGGAWIGFHFAAFAMDGSTYNQDWDWYHDEFLGSGEYVSNTWEPTSVTLKIETHDHFATEDLPDAITSSVCEWYRWEHDLRENPDITVLASIDESSFPVGTKAGEIWYEGDYPIVWANNNYNMVYFNMGHNLVNYNLNNLISNSSSFDSEEQNRMLLQTMFGLTA